MSKRYTLKLLFGARMGAVFGALVGLVLGIIYSFGGLIVDLGVTLGWITSAETPGLSWGTVLAFGALIGMPIIFAIPGIVLGTIAALLAGAFGRR